MWSSTAVFRRLGEASLAPFRWYHRRLTEAPLMVKSLTSGTVIASADLLSQRLPRPPPLSEQETHRAHKAGEVTHEHWWNARQTMWMALYGSLFVAPFSHSWYQVRTTHHPPRPQSPPPPVLPPLQRTLTVFLVLGDRRTVSGAQAPDAGGTVGGGQASAGGAARGARSSRRVSRLRLWPFSLSRTHRWYAPKLVTMTRHDQRHDPHNTCR
jgi:hypothetical protein